MSGRLNADPLYLGLARPAMVAGVSYTYFALNAMLILVLFIQSQNFLVFIVAIITHGFGYILCSKEPRAIELWMLRMREGYKSFNRFFHHHTNSYDVY